MLIYKNKAGNDTMGLTLTKAGNPTTKNGVKSIQLIPEKTVPFELSKGYVQDGLVYLN
jgi:hypothetical protein